MELNACTIDWANIRPLAVDGIISFKPDSKRGRKRKRIKQTNTKKTNLQQRKRVALQMHPIHWSLVFTSVQLLSIHFWLMLVAIMMVFHYHLISDDDDSTQT